MAEHCSMCPDHHRILRLSLTKQRQKKNYIKCKKSVEKDVGGTKRNWFEELTLRSLPGRKCPRDVLLSPKSQDESSFSITPDIIKQQYELTPGSSAPLSVGHLLDSQLMTPSPLKGWSPPLVGISPISSSQDDDYLNPSSISQSNMIKSLGINPNDSGMSWTSSLATPSLAKLPDSPGSCDGGDQRLKGIPRALFSPGVETLEERRLDDTTDDSATFSDHSVTCAEQGSKANGQSDVHNQDCCTKERCQNHSTSETSEIKMEPTDEPFSMPLFSQDDTENNCDASISQLQTARSKESEFHSELSNLAIEGPIKEEIKVEVISDALSDFFDPPSKSVGRRRCAPSRNKKRKSVDNDDFIDVNSPGFDVVRVDYAEMKQVPSSKKRKVTDLSCDSYDPVSNLCSTPKEAGISVKSILSSEKKKSSQDRRRKRVRFSESGDEVKIFRRSFDKSCPERVSGYTEKDNSAHVKDECPTGDVGNLKVTEDAKKLIAGNIKHEICDTGLKHFETGNNLKTSTCAEAIGETRTEVFEDLFSQVSPTSLSEMCCAAIVEDRAESPSPVLGSKKSTKASKRMSNMGLDTEGPAKASPLKAVVDDTSVSRDKDSINSKEQVHVNDSEDNVTKVHSVESTTTPNSDTTDGNTNTSIGEIEVSEKKSLSLRSKTRKFFYPTKKQIKTSCPENVYEFANKGDSSKVISQSEEPMSEKLSSEISASKTNVNKACTEIGKSGEENQKSSPYEQKSDFSGFQRFSAMKGDEEEEISFDSSTELTAGNTRGDAVLDGAFHRKMGKTDSTQNTDSIEDSSANIIQSGNVETSVHVSEFNKSVSPAVKLHDMETKHSSDSATGVCVKTVLTNDSQGNEVSSKSISSEDQIHVSKESSSRTEAKDVPKFVSFRTARGKDISFSKSSLSTAKEFLSGVESGEEKEDYQESKDPFMKDHVKAPVTRQQCCKTQSSKEVCRSKNEGKDLFADIFEEFGDIDRRVKGDQKTNKNDTFHITCGKEIDFKVENVKLSLEVAGNPPNKETGAEHGFGNVVVKVDFPRDSKPGLCASGNDRNFRVDKVTPKKTEKREVGGLFADIFEEYGDIDMKKEQLSGEGVIKGFKCASEKDLKSDAKDKVPSGKKGRDLFADIFEEFGNPAAPDSSINSVQTMTGFKSASGSDVRPDFHTVVKKTKHSKEVERTNMVLPINDSKTLSNPSARKTKGSELFADIFDEYGMPENDSLKTNGFIGFKSAAGSEFKPTFISVSGMGNSGDQQSKPDKKQSDVVRGEEKDGYTGTIAEPKLPIGANIGRASVNHKPQMKSASLAAKFSTGPTLPKGFRPFKPPKLTKPKPKDASVEEAKPVLLDRKVENHEKGKVETSVNVDENVPRENKNSAACSSTDYNDFVDQGKLETSLIDEIFMEEMEWSQKCSPEPGRPLKKAKIDSDTLADTVTLCSSVGKNKIDVGKDKEEHIKTAFRSDPGYDSINPGKRRKTESCDSEFGEEFYSEKELEMIEGCLTGRIEEKTVQSNECSKELEMVNATQNTTEKTIENFLELTDTRNVEEKGNAYQVPASVSKIVPVNGDTSRMNLSAGAGFTTAAGKEVKLSEKSLSAARKLLESNELNKSLINVPGDNDGDWSLMEKQQSDNKSSTEHSLGETKVIDHSVFDELDKPFDEHTLQHKNLPDCKSELKDQTSNGSVEVKGPCSNKESIGKDVYHEGITSENIHVGKGGDASSIPAFRTASGREIKVTEKAVEASRKLLEEVSDTDSRCSLGREVDDQLSFNESNLNLEIQALTTEKLDTVNGSDRPNTACLAEQQNPSVAHDLQGNLNQKDVVGMKEPLMYHDGRKTDEAVIDKSNDSAGCSEAVSDADLSSISTDNRNGICQGVTGKHHFKTAITEDEILQVFPCTEEKINDDVEDFSSLSNVKVGVDDRRGSDEELCSLQTQDFSLTDTFRDPILCKTDVTTNILENSLHLYQKRNVWESGQESANSTFDRTIEISLVSSTSSQLPASHTLESDHETLNSPFQSASGKSINVSAKSLQTARQTIDSDQKTLNSPFQSASGKSLNVSAKSLQVARQTLESDHETLNSLFQSASGKSINVSAKLLQAARQTMESDHETLNSPFQSASGKSINVSAKLLQAARQTMESDHETLNSPFQSASGKSIHVSAKSLHAARHTLESDHETLNSPFQSASGKSINVSAKSLQAARHTLESDHETLNSPFQSASGKSIHVSAKSLHAARHTLESDHETLNSPFRSASGKSINVSAKSLQAARHTLESDHETLNSPFQSASGKSINVSAKSLQTARQTMESDHETLNSPFQSASGKSINVSAKSLQTARQTMESDHETLNSPFQSASGKSIRVSAKSLQAARHTLESDHETLNSPFQSASGKSIKVSAKSLQAARHTLESDHETLNSPFQSASGKSINVSAKSLQTARQTMESDHEILNSPFQSASGKSINVSAKSLQAARHTLESDHETLNSPFQSASGKSINVSAKSLQAARQTLESDHETLNSPFQSASGKSINVSAKSLQAARHTLESDHETLNSPFQSASGKSINVSAKSLQAARQTLESDQETQNSPFQSASGKSINVSTKSFLEQDKSLPGEREVPKSVVQKLYDKHVNKSESLFQRDMDKEVQAYEQFIVPDDFDEEMESPPDAKNRISGQKPSMKPLSVGPEGYTKDRPVINSSRKPFHCRKLQGKSASPFPPSNSLANMEKVSSFITPYKDVAKSTPESEVRQCPPVNVKSAMPVFGVKHALQHQIRDSKSSLGSRTMKGAMQTAPTGNSGMESYRTGTEEVMSNSKDFLPINCSGLDTATCLQVNKIKLINEARKKQAEMVEGKRKVKVNPVAGILFKAKSQKGRQKLGDVIELGQVQRKQLHTSVDPAVSITAGNASRFRFRMSEFYPTETSHVYIGDGAFVVPDNDGFLGTTELYQAFLTVNGVDQGLISREWFINHYRWIVWKLAAYDRMSQYRDCRWALTPENVMLQMKYRYDREVDRCHRSAIKKIAERDDSPCKRMVLAVSSIQHKDVSSIQHKDVSSIQHKDVSSIQHKDGSHRDSDTDKHSGDSKVCLELTDGWYCVPTSIDVPLTHLILRGSIRKGQKLCISGAEIVGTQDACPPLEMPAGMSLKISANSTRPAPWDCRLGYQTDPRPLCVPLSTLYGEGGSAGCVEVVLARKYPTMYMEKLADGGCVFRSAQAEEKHQQQYQQSQQDKMEKLYRKMEGQFEDDEEEENCITKKSWSRHEAEQLHTGHEIYEAYRTARQPDILEGYFSERQMMLLMEHKRQVMEEKRQRLLSDFNKAWAEDQQSIQRAVVPLLKLRVIGCCRKDLDTKMSFMISVWRPGPEYEQLKEGTRYRMYGLAASTARSKYAENNIQLTASRQTKFKALPLDENVLDLVFEPRRSITVSDLRSCLSPYGEADVVGVVISVVHTDFGESGKTQDIVYCTDCNRDIVGIKFWGGSKVSGTGENLVPGKILCFCNLLDKSNFRSAILPLLEWSSECSTCSQNPQGLYQRKVLEEIQDMVRASGGMTSFLEDGNKILEEVLQHKTDMKNKARTPEKSNQDLAKDCATPVSVEKAEKVKKHALLYQNKMSHLMSYGSPQPLSPIASPLPKTVKRDFVPPKLSWNNSENKKASDS